MSCPTLQGSQAVHLQRPCCCGKVRGAQNQHSNECQEACPNLPRPGRHHSLTSTTASNTMQWGAEQPSSSSSFAKDAKGVTTLQVFKRLLRSFASRASLLICPRATDFRGGEGEREPFNLCILQKNETNDMININKMYLSHKVAENSATVVFRKLSSEISSENSAVS